MNVVDSLQWPAMAVTIAASWMIASSSSRHRNVGFWLFLLSNALWVAWGWNANAPALVALQIGLAAMNIRGAMKTEMTGKPGTPNDGSVPGQQRRSATAAEPNVDLPHGRRE